MITTIKEAVEKLNEVKHRNYNSWIEGGGCALCEITNDNCDVLPPDDVIRIARSYELEEELAHVQSRAIEHSKVADGATFEVERLKYRINFLEKSNLDWCVEYADLKELCAEFQKESMETLDMMDECYATLVPNGEFPPQRFWKQVATKIEKFQDALEQISHFKDCSGPGCFFCDNREWEDSSDSDHPFTAEALIARRVLGLK